MIPWSPRKGACRSRSCSTRVERPAGITVRYTDLDGSEVTRDAADRLAVCMQHEIDHLDGVLYIDYLSRLKRERVIKKFDKAARRATA